MSKSAHNPPQDSLPASGLPSSSSGPQRMLSIDLVRGAIMLLMVLDHTRDYFHNYSQYFKTTDLATTTSAIFFTRWITHFCAPGFVFLAGISIFLRRQHDSDTIVLSNFLLLRGLFLILLEMTVVRFAWDFTGHPYFYAQIMWVLGFSMLLMSLVVRPKRALVAAIALGILAFMVPGFLESPAVYIACFGKGTMRFPNGFFIVFNYPIFQWFLVMLGGYYFGWVMAFPDTKRRKIAAVCGAVLLASFFALRILNIGDIGWKDQAADAHPVLAFLNCSKLPPSLPFFLMTIGVIVLALSIADGIWRYLKPLLVLGRVPLFFYIAHLYVIHTLAVAVTVARSQDIRWALPFTIWFPPPQSSNYGFGLPVVYLVSMIVVLMLYPICRVLSRLKQAKKYSWLSYL
jgi:uncharacterized membrane protein